MNTRVRWLLAWLLALSLPLQGFAATSMLMCGSLHHAAMQSVPAHHLPAYAAPVDASPAHAGHHGDGEPGADQSDPRGTAQVYGQCSLCAACCAGLALTPHVPVLHAARAGNHFEPVHVEPGAGFLTGGIERPPRLCLA